MTPDTPVIAYRNELLRMLSRLVPVTGACFYLVDDRLRVHSHGMYRIGYEALPTYLADFIDIDPYHPRHYNDGVTSVVSSATIASCIRHQYDDYFGQFMRPINVAHEVDLYFRSAGRIVAGVSLLRSAALGSFADAELIQLSHVHGFIECTIKSLCVERPTINDSRLLRRFAFTKRQIDIIQLVKSGASNQEIGRYAAIELPTVKSHLAQIYRTAKVCSRTELLAKLYFEDGAA